MLKVLALDPDNADATKALRDIDRQKLARIQTSRAARVGQAATARKRPVRDWHGGRGGKRILRHRSAHRDIQAGDVEGGLKELHAFVDANPNNQDARQRIATTVYDRGREAENKGAREQALMLYDQAVALRGKPAPEWTAQAQKLRRTISDEYYDKGMQAYRTDTAAAIKLWETSLRYDPQNPQGDGKTAGGAAGARQAQAHRAASEVAYFGAPNFSFIFCFRSSDRSRSSFAFWLEGSSSRMRSHFAMERSRFCRWNACVPSRSRLRISAVFAASRCMTASLLPGKRVAASLNVA